jgi:DNA-binding beta-propeller fold protein YncE
VISGRSNAVTATVRVGKGPVGIAIDQQTRTLYVANTASKTVSVLTSCG